LRDDQPLTDLGLDSLMGVEIETMIEGSIGVALPPTSLMRARTIGQIASLISEHLGGGAESGAVAKTATAEAATPAVEVDVDSLSDDDIDRLLGGTTDSASDEVASTARDLATDATR
jgi:Phosphopantetheine attachment site